MSEGILFFWLWVFSIENQHFSIEKMFRNPVFITLLQSSVEMMLEKPDFYTKRAISCRNGSWKHHFLHSCNSVIQTMPKSCALDNEPASFSPNAALIKAFREESAKISLKAVENTSLREQTSKSSLNTARITRFREQTPTVLFEQPSKQAF